MTKEQDKFSEKNKNPHFAKMVRQILDAHRLSYKEFGERAGCTKGAVQNYLLGRVPRHDILKNISQTFELAIEDLIGDDPSAVNRIQEPRVVYTSAPRTTSSMPVIELDQAALSADLTSIPDSFKEAVPYQPRDAKAFAILITNRSAEPFFREGDYVVVSPAKPSRGDIVAARIEGVGILFAKYQPSLKPGMVALSPLGDVPKEYPASKVSWTYPVEGSFRKYR